MKIFLKILLSILGVLSRMLVVVFLLEMKHKDPLRRIYEIRLLKAENF